MLDKIKSYLTIISIIIAILASGYGVFSKVRADRLKGERDSALDELKVKTTEVVTYKNTLGQVVTKTVEYERYIGDLEFSNDSLERAIYKTIKASKIREKDLKKIYAFNMKSKTSGEYDTTYFVDNPKVTDSTSVAVLETIEVKEFKDSHYHIIVYPDSIKASYDAKFVLLSGARRVPRKWQPFKWAGWTWKKTIDRDMVEITSDDKEAKYNGRMIKVK